MYILSHADGQSIVHQLYLRFRSPETTLMLLLSYCPEYYDSVEIIGGTTAKSAFFYRMVEALERPSLLHSTIAASSLEQ